MSRDDMVPSAAALSNKRKRDISSQHKNPSPQPSTAEVAREENHHEEELMARFLHLLSRQALEYYLDHLAPGNRKFLDLAKEALAKTQGTSDAPSKDRDVFEYFSHMKETMYDGSNLHDLHDWKRELQSIASCYHFSASEIRRAILQTVTARARTVIERIPEKELTLDAAFDSLVLDVTRGLPAFCRSLRKNAGEDYRMVTREALIQAQAYGRLFTQAAVDTQAVLLISTLLYKYEDNPAIRIFNAKLLQDCHGNRGFV